MSNVSAAATSYRCKQHLSPIHDFFISYRVASEEKIASELFGELTALSKHNGDPIKVFWDQRCLNDAANWQEGFMNGLRGSRVIILLISVAGLSRMATASSSYKDNLLLEWEEALLLSKTSSVAIFPILIGTTQNVPAEMVHVDGSKESQTKPAYFPFSFAQAALTKFPSVPHGTSGKVIRDTLSQIFAIQGASYFPKAINHLAKQLRELLYNLEEENANQIRKSILRFEKINLPNIYLVKLSIRGLSIRDACFKKAVLPFADLKNTDCSNADFSDALLHGVNLKGADLTNICLSNADCSGVFDSNVFKHAVIDSPIIRLPTQFYRTNFSFANISNFGSSPVNFERCTLSGASVRGQFLNTKFTFCEIKNSNFVNLEFGGEWRSKCEQSVFKLCVFKTGTAKDFTEYFTDCVFVDVQFHVIPSRGMNNCRFERCSFSSLDGSLGKFEDCAFIGCHFSDIKLYTTRETGIFRTNCELTKCKLLDCKFIESQFHTISDCIIQGSTVWKTVEITHLERAKIGLSALKYESPDNKSVSNQLTTMPFENSEIVIKKITGLRSSGVVWDKDFPGKAVMEDCKFKFNHTKQAEDFIANLPKAGVILVEGADGKIDTRRVEDPELNIEYVEQIWINHKPAVVCVNCPNTTSDNFLV